MNDFIERLVDLRGGLGKVGRGIGKVAKGTLENMGNVREREQQMLDTERERNRRMIEENFGSVENYEQFLRENPMPKTFGESLGDFFGRLLHIRSDKN